MISWDRVADLRSEVGEDDFSEVVEVFLEEVDETVARLKRLPDMAQLEDDMHFLKGSALNLGFKAMTAVCEDGERAAAGGRPDLVDLRKLVEVYEASRVEFLKHRDTAHS
ncbi:Hpt domain-containing protein [Aliiroseovarius sp. YM-037]|uniref:Hpt domain-containing protein n=1 Tax=Aliiroseovarius sp. YM-037 TaxID=3341728 RepID=UPI003A8133CD